MLRKSRIRAMKALVGSAILLALPLTTGCQTGNFGGNIPGYGTIAGWWGGAEKPDPNKPPAGYQMPSSKADPNGQSYAGGANRGARRGADGDYGAEGSGAYDRSAPGGYGAQGPSYAAGNRANPNNWEKGNRKSTAPSYGSETEGEFAGTPKNGGGYGAAPRGERSTPGYDPYGGATPSTGADSEGASPRSSAYSADTRNGAGARGAGGYNTRMASGSQRATKSAPVEEEGYTSEEPAPSTGSRFSSRDAAETPRGARSSVPAEEEDGAMTADEDAETGFPQTKGYGSGYKVPATRGSSTSSTERRYPSSGASSRSINDDYGMTETTEEAEGEATVEKVAATESTRRGLSSKALGILERGEGDFRPGSTGRSDYRTASKVAPAGYSSEDTEEESTDTGRTTSRFAE